MIETIVIVATGLMGGVAVGTQAPIAGAMGQRIGGASSSLIVHLGGAVASLLLVMARRGELIDEWRTLPWYMIAEACEVQTSVRRIGSGCRVVSRLDSVWSTEG